MEIGIEEEWERQSWISRERLTLRRCERKRQSPHEGEEGAEGALSPMGPAPGRIAQSGENPEEGPSPGLGRGRERAVGWQLERGRSDRRECKGTGSIASQCSK